MTAINWDTRNNNQFQTYFSVDVRLRASPPFRDGVTLEPGRFSYALENGDIAYSSYPYLQTSSCTPPVLLYSSTCRINFMFRHGLSRADLVPAVLSYTFGLSGSVDIIQLP